MNCALIIMVYTIEYLTEDTKRGDRYTTVSFMIFAAKTPRNSECKVYNVNFVFHPPGGFLRF